MTESSAIFLNNTAAFFCATAVDVGPDLPKRSLYTPAEVVDFFQVHRNTVYEWIDRGVLQGRKVGGCVRVPVSSIIRVISPST